MTEQVRSAWLLDCGLLNLDSCGLSGLQKQTGEEREEKKERKGDRGSSTQRGEKVTTSGRIGCTRPASFRKSRRDVRFLTLVQKDVW